MLNQFVVVGRVNNYKNNFIKLNVTRNYKNDNGEYDIDIIKIYVNDNLKYQCEKHLYNDRLLGVKGRIEQYKNETRIVAERLTTLESANGE